MVSDLPCLKTFEYGEDGDVGSDPVDSSKINGVRYEAEVCVDDWELEKVSGLETRSRRLRESLTIEESAGCEWPLSSQLAIASHPSAFTLLLEMYADSLGSFTKL